MDRIVIFEVVLYSYNKLTIKAGDAEVRALTVNRASFYCMRCSIGNFVATVWHVFVSVVERRIEQVCFEHVVFLTE